VPSRRGPGAGGEQVEPAVECDAVRLFTHRAASAAPGFALTDANAEAVAESTSRAVHTLTRALSRRRQAAGRVIDGSLVGVDCRG
jgi:predicted ATPase